MNLKNVLSIIGAIIILLVLFVGASYLQSRDPSRNNVAAPGNNEQGDFVIKNDEFGYSFEMSEVHFGANDHAYKEIRNGYNTTYYLKLSDQEAQVNDQQYTDVLTIGAVTMREYNQNKAMCAKNNTILQQTPFDCMVYDQPLGHNKYLYFFEYPQIVQYPQEFEDVKLGDAIAASLKNIKIFDPAVEPLSLQFDSQQLGYSFNYPSYTDRTFWDPDNNRELGAEIKLPKEFDSEESNIGEKVIMHTLPIQYCALSGKCNPTTLNFAINVGYSGRTFKQLRTSSIWEGMQHKTIGEYNVYIYEIGAEGEGIIYYFADGPDNKIYVVALKYINEQVMPKYKTASGFTSFEEQKATAENIIKILDFQDPMNKL